MYKKLFLFSLVLLICLTIAFSMSVASQSIVIKLSHGDAAEGDSAFKQKGCLTFKSLVETRSDGRLKIEIYPNSQLGSEREMFEGVMMGTTQMTWSGTAVLAGWIPEISVLNLPYLFNSPVVAFKVLDGDFGRDLNKLLIEKTGLRFLSYGHIGFKHFTNNVRPIKTPADLKGLKIRTRENPTEIQMVKSLGASATPIAWGELYTSLQQGVVDGEENPTSMIQVAKLYEVQKYLTLDGHIFGVEPICINEKFYQSLPDDLKFIVADSASIASMVYRGLMELGSASDILDLTVKGMEIYAPSPAEVAQFKEVCQVPVKESLVKEIGNEWVDKLFGAIKQAEKEYASENE